MWTGISPPTPGFKQRPINAISALGQRYLGGLSLALARTRPRRPATRPPRRPFHDGPRLLSPAPRPGPPGAQRKATPGKRSYPVLTALWPGTMPRWRGSSGSCARCRTAGIRGEGGCPWITWSRSRRCCGRGRGRQPGGRCGAGRGGPSPDPSPARGAPRRRRAAPPPGRCDVLPGPRRTPTRGRSMTSCAPTVGEDESVIDRIHRVASPPQHPRCRGGRDRVRGVLPCQLASPVDGAARQGLAPVA